MYGYWLMFLLPTMALLAPYRASYDLRRLAWILIGLLYTLMIGFRHDVGGDWDSYLDHFAAIQYSSWSDAFINTDPGYAFINWVSGRIYGGIYLVNLVCGFVTMAGIIIFCQRQPLPWLSLLVAVPYLIVVVAMGYTRQSVAIGFELLALVALMDRKLYRFLIFIICGSLFHKTAVILIPLALLCRNRDLFRTFFWLGVTGFILGFMVLFEHYDSLLNNYVAEGMTSEGGSIRVGMNALPALLLLAFRKKLTPEGDERRLWIWISLFSLACIPFLEIASTAVDRLALYLIPIQLYVFSRITKLFVNRHLRSAAVVVVGVGYALVLWLWLNFANNSTYWLPYKFALFVE